MTVLHGLCYFPGENSLPVGRYKVMQVPGAGSKGRGCETVKEEEGYCCA